MLINPIGVRARIKKPINGYSYSQSVDENPLFLIWLLGWEWSHFHKFGAGGEEGLSWSSKLGKIILIQSWTLLVLLSVGLFPQ